MLPAEAPSPKCSAPCPPADLLPRPRRLFQYSPQRLLDSVPTMFAFPKLSEVFGTIASKIAATVRTGVCRLLYVVQGSWQGLPCTSRDGSIAHSSWQQGQAAGALVAK